VGLLALLALVLALAGCMSIPEPVSGGNTSMVIGQLKLEVSGVGSAPNGSYGVINAVLNSGSVLTLASVTGGKKFELKTTTADGMFTMPNAEPGEYILVKLRHRIRTSNAFIDIESDYTDGPEIDVSERHIVDMGIIHWSFRYDLVAGTSSNTVTFEDSNPAVLSAFAQLYPKSAWLRYETSPAGISGQKAAAPDSSVDANTRPPDNN
jgi:hypothetical protein